MTLKDVALLSNCSIATVSKAFKNSPEVSAETKKRIIKAATDCGYIKKATAHTAILGGIKTVIFADLDFKYLKSFEAIKKLAEKYNFSLLYLSENTEKALSVMEQIGAVGIILTVGNTEDGNSFSFSGDQKALEKFFAELKGFTPKRKSRAKSEGTERKPNAKKAEAKTQEKSDSEIWLL